MATYIFTYGSLMSPISFSQTVGRKLPPSDFMPARLHGYSKSWSANGAQQCFLNIVPDKYADTWGVLVKINSEDELNALDMREALYSRIDVSKHVNTDLYPKYKKYLLGSDIVYTYIVTDPKILSGSRKIYFNYYCLCYTASLIYGVKFYRKWRADLTDLKFE